MKKIIYVFEDSGFENLLPLTYTAPAWEILCGARTLLEKIIALYPGADVRLICRDYLADAVGERTRLKVNYFDSVLPDAKCLFLNGRVIFEKSVAFDGDEESGLCGETLAYARIKPERIGGLNEGLFLKNRIPSPFAELKKTKFNLPMINYFWDVIELCPQQIMRDIKSIKARGRFSRVTYKGVHKIDSANILIGKRTTIKPGTVLDAGSGPIFIGDNVVTEANSVIEGPSVIADGCIIRAGAVIKGSSIGRCCRIGGEVSQSIIHSFSNKQHGGYLGNSYVGRWCNIGAGTNNSDLKNNYGNVKVLFENKAVDTGRMHLGILIADHSKCAVGTNFSCGTIVGVCSNVFGKPIPPKFIRSFQWGDDVYDIDLAVSTARVVMKRRQVDLSETEENLLRKIFTITHP